MPEGYRIPPRSTTALSNNVRAIPVRWLHAVLFTPAFTGGRKVEQETGLRLLVCPTARSKTLAPVTGLRGWK